jgi:hypothetical protein
MRAGSQGYGSGKAEKSRAETRATGWKPGEGEEGAGIIGSTCVIPPTLTTVVLRVHSQTRRAGTGNDFGIREKTHLAGISRKSCVPARHGYSASRTVRLKRTSCARDARGTAGTSDAARSTCESRRTVTI